MEGFVRKDAWNDRPIPSTDAMQLPQLSSSGHARESPGDRRGVGGVAAFSGVAQCSWPNHGVEGRELVSSGCLGLGLGLGLCI
jgi:hypothetical protein